MKTPKKQKLVAFVIGGYSKNCFGRKDNKWRRAISLEYAQSIQTHQRTFHSKEDQRKLLFSR